jgi:hypothetical protein
MHNDLFIGVVPFADDAEVLHIDASLGQLLNGSFGALMIGENRDYGTTLCHCLRTP